MLNFGNNFLLVYIDRVTLEWIAILVPFYEQMPQGLPRAINFRKFTLANHQPDSSVLQSDRIKARWRSW